LAIPYNQADARLDSAWRQFLSPPFEGRVVKKFFVFSLGLVVALTTAGMTASVGAAEAATEGHVKSGPAAGEYLGPFTVTKVAGAEDDSVAEGKKLCYRCKNGSRPQVVVFTRSTDPQVAQLVSKIDEAIVKHDDEKLTAFVNVLGSDPEAATETAKKFAMTSKAKNIPFVVPNEFENGPEDYGINPNAEVTVTLAVDGKILASHGFTKGSDVCIDTVMADLASLVK
jgi:ribosomal protein L18